MIKLNKLVKTISTYFKKIELKNGIYFCEPKSTMLYLIPIDKSECRFQNIVGRIFKNAPEVDELAKFFTTSKPTCYRMRAEVVKR